MDVSGWIARRITLQSEEGGSAMALSLPPRTKSIFSHDNLQSIPYIEVECGADLVNFM